jgi:hypothetical protein
MTAPQYPSLDLIRTELDLRLADQARKAATFDTRAGVVLGFGGVLIGLVGEDPTIFQLLGQIVAALAAGVAGVSMRYRVSGSMNIRAVRDRYLNQEPEVTRLRLLDTRIVLLEQDEVRFESKVRVMAWAVRLLAFAVLLMLVGSIVSFVR